MPARASRIARVQKQEDDDESCCEEVEACGEEVDVDLNKKTR